MISSTDDLRLLAEERIAEAKALLAANHYSGAYYLAGYAVELGLKAVLTSELTSHAMPNKFEVADAHIHDLRKLARQGALNPASEPAISVSWNVVVSDWGPESRYRFSGQVAAEQMVEAAEEVLTWLTRLW